MVKLFGKQYYIDIDGITAKCRTDKTITEEDGSESLEINIFKYEIIKMCLDRVLSEYEEDDELAVYKKDNGVSFNIAFNTLIKYEILIEEDDE